MSGQEKGEQFDAELLLQRHRQTGEPLTAEEMDAVIIAGLTDRASSEHRGSGLYWYADIHPASKD
jgi:hypothetical protein